MFTASFSSFLASLHSSRPSKNFIHVTCLRIITAVFALLPAVAGFAQAPSPAEASKVSASGAADCTKSAASLPQGASRVYIALRNGKDGSGASAADARDGSTVESLDTILRCYSEGCADSGNPHKTVAKTENLIVCLGPGTFHTKGTYDFMINLPHQPQGFTIGKGWKIHGSGVGVTTVQLVALFVAPGPKNPQNIPEGTGVGVVFSTNSDEASGVEVSDLTVDCNYPALKAEADHQNLSAINLEGVHLRSFRGGHWIHDLHVLNTAGELGARWETFPVWIVSVRQTAPPSDNNGNVIERVRMSSFTGQWCTAIAVGTAVAEVRNNTVEGYKIAYGGWMLGTTLFHHNVSIESEYGFNIDSLANQGTRIQANQIIHPRNYGMVIGGGGSYADFDISGNTIQINKPGVIGLLFQGNVTGTVVRDNNITAESRVKATAIRNTGTNVNNVYEANRMSSSLKAAFQGSSSQSRSCFFGNVDETAKPSKEFADNHRGTCLKGK